MEEIRAGKVVKKRTAGEMSPEEREARLARRAALGMPVRSADAGNEAGSAPMPPGGVMVRNLARAGWEALRGVARGGRQMRTEEEQAAALAVCRRNECGMWNAEKGRCGQCGCFTKWKARLAAWDCPKGLWPKLTPGEG